MRLICGDQVLDVDDETGHRILAIQKITKATQWNVDSRTDKRDSGSEASQKRVRTGKASSK